MSHLSKFALVYNEIQNRLKNHFIKLIFYFANKRVINYAVPNKKTFEEFLCFEFFMNGFFDGNFEFCLNISSLADSKKPIPKSKDGKKSEIIENTTKPTIEVGDVNKIISANSIQPTLNPQCDI